MKISFLSITMLLILALSSCNKKRCWQCNVFTSYQSDPNGSPTKDTSYRKCEYTKDEMNKYEQEVRFDSGFVNTQGMSDTMFRRTYCEKAKRNVGSDIWPHF